MKTTKQEQPTETAEQPEVKTETSVTMTVETYCAHKEYNKIAEAQLRVFLIENEAEPKYKTAEEWDKIYSHIMNRVTK